MVGVGVRDELVANNFEKLYDFFHPIAPPHELSTVDFAVFCKKITQIFLDVCLFEGSGGELVNFGSGLADADKHKNECLLSQFFLFVEVK